MAVANQVAQPREVAGVKGGQQLIRRSRDLADEAERVVALRPRELSFHMRECRSDNLVVVDVGPDRLRCIEPHAVNQTETGGCQPGRVPKPMGSERRL